MQEKCYAPLLCALALIGLAAGPARAQDQGFGLGIILGEPTGISGKSWIVGSTAMDFAAAWSFERNNSLTLHADYLNHHFTLIRVDQGRLPLYYGIGGRIKFNDRDRPVDDEDLRVGVRIPVGLAYFFDNVTLDIFLEVVPILDLVPATDFRVNAAFGVRYFF